VVEKIDLFINDTSGKAHIVKEGSTSYALCGAHLQGPRSVLRVVETTPTFTSRDWCSSCIKHVAMGAIAGKQRFRSILDYVLNKRPVKKETVIDSVRTELTFDSEEMAIKIIAGKTTGAKGDFTVQTKMELAFGWDKLESFRDLTEELDGVEEVKLTIFSERRPDEV